MTGEQNQQLATYDGDFCAWLEQQAALMRAGRFDLLDVENIVEELEGLSRSDKRALRSHVSDIIVLLLRLESQPLLRDAIREIDIRKARRAALYLMDDSPSLGQLLPVMLEEEYSDAVFYASRETGFLEKNFPAKCPYTVDQILDVDFFPETE